MFLYFSFFFFCLSYSDQKIKHYNHFIFYLLTIEDKVRMKTICF